MAPRCSHHARSNVVQQYVFCCNSANNSIQVCGVDLGQFAWAFCRRPSLPKNRLGHFKLTISHSHNLSKPCDVAAFGNSCFLFLSCWLVSLAPLVCLGLLCTCANHVVVHERFFG